MKVGSDRIYVIGDVHGRLDLLKWLERCIGNDSGGGNSPWIVLVGDLVDRGPSSSAVIDHVINQQRASDRYLALMGNHEAMMLAALLDPADMPTWLVAGGEQTLASYGARESASSRSSAVPQEHIDWLAALPISFESERYFICHAGVRPELPLSEQEEDDLIWRYDDPSTDYVGVEKPVVHGHAMVNDVLMQKHRISIDTGAYATGKLSGVRLSTEDEPLAIWVDASRGHDQLSRRPAECWSRLRT